MFDLKLKVIFKLICQVDKLDMYCTIVPAHM